MAADRLSVLPDDILRCVLSFAPAKDAAASALLSRRWRSLWRGTSAVVLDSRPYTKAERELYNYSPPTLYYFFRDAHAALAAFPRRRNGRLKRLTLFLEEAAFQLSSRYCYSDPEPDQSRVADLLDDPAIARLSELSITCENSHLSRYAPPLDSLRCAATLRVLELRRCSFAQPSPAGGGPSFPHLKDMTLENCCFLEGYLQVMIDAAPALARLAVVNVRQMAMLLRSCPAISELRLRLNMRWSYDHERKYKDHVGGPFAESMDRFELLASMSSARRAAVQLSGVSEFFPDTALTNGRDCNCLRKSLRKVTLQFKAKEVDCFEVQLAKFLAENAMVLEEMHVDDGSRFWPDHLLHKLARWRADAFEGKNLLDTGKFAVYQLAKGAVHSDKEQPSHGWQ